MMTRNLLEIVAMCGGVLHAAQGTADSVRATTVTGVFTDSRKVAPGGLFVAIAGEHDDGHQFVPAAARAGAVAILVHDLDGVRSALADAGLAPGSLNLITVSDTVEALIGATYLSQGLEPTRAVVERLVARFLSSARTRGASLDWKTSLQELVAAHGLGNPRYEVESVGPDHERVFTAQAIVDGAVRGEGTGTSKKLAEHKAAEAAYASILASHGDGGLDLPGVNEALRADLRTQQS